MWGALKSIQTAATQAATQVANSANELLDQLEEVTAADDSQQYDDESTDETVGEGGVGVMNEDTEALQRYRDSSSSAAVTGGTASTDTPHGTGDNRFEKLFDAKGNSSDIVTEAALLAKEAASNAAQTIFSVGKLLPLPVLCRLVSSPRARTHS